MHLVILGALLLQQVAVEYQRCAFPCMSYVWIVIQKCSIWTILLLLLLLYHAISLAETLLGLNIACICDLRSVCPYSLFKFFLVRVEMFYSSSSQNLTKIQVIFLFFQTSGFDLSGSSLRNLYLKAIFRKEHFPSAGLPFKGHDKHFELPIWPK